MKVTYQQNQPDPSLGKKIKISAEDKFELFHNCACWSYACVRLEMLNRRYNFDAIELLQYKFQKRSTRYRYNNVSYHATIHPH